MMISNILMIFLIAFCVSLILAPFIIKGLRKLKAGQNILEYVDAHKSKQGTPTMGGIIFLLGLLVAYLFTFGGDNRLSTIMFLVTLGYGLLGFLDDFLKIKLKHNEGLKAYQKFIGQFGIACIVAYFVYSSNIIGTSIAIPFSSVELDCGWGIIPFIVFFYLAVTNSVNLTDGLDGLAGKTSFVYLISFTIVAFLMLNNGVQNDVILEGEYGNLFKLTAGLCGGILAFLVFNSHPARVFMGDTGSLALGGFVATYAVFTKSYLLMPIIGLMFVLNTLSVVIQVGYYKITKKRIFKMAPLHHHFEKCGVKETKVVSAYTIVTIVMGVIAIWLTLL